MSEDVKLIHVTPDAEKVMAYCARVSSANQDSADLHLLEYCARHGHWSVFEMASMCLEITTSRGISPQILRHGSFSFQEFSQRYASQKDFVQYEARRQDIKNRQNSTDDLDKKVKQWFESAQLDSWQRAKERYDMAIEMGIAKECARFLLPASTQTRLYMHGTVRSWIHYLQLRTTPRTQKEHREIAVQAREIFKTLLPTCAQALGWLA